ncbi:MAG: Lipid-A-disaccharide synthase [Cellvibrionales bacterium UBA7375]|nr:MAG: Lipid-A-disaccharide synthase [Cellvibrionales bacterium UBA7375]
MTQAPVFAIVAGETSGDLLGADLIQGLKKQYPNAIFEGIGGPKMQAQGFNSLFDMERLSVMGLWEPLKRLPELLSIRRSIIKRYSTRKPIVFIGIDSPDFNAKVEQKLHAVGVKTVHYVSPSVWAWRQGRIKNIKRSVDLMLTLLPFEAKFYHQHQVPVCYVGHPLAKQFPQQPNTSKARQALGLELNQPTLCIMSGSRSAEVELMAELLLDAAAKASQDLGVKLQLIVPAANQSRYDQLKKILDARSDNITLLKQQSHQAMEAADAVLLTSGTTALEAMLLKKPMVVSYRMNPLSFKLLFPLIKTPFISLPNLLANQLLVPELIQDKATVETLAAEVVNLYKANSTELVEHFNELHQQLFLDSASLATAAISKLIASE